MKALIRQLVLVILIGSGIQLAAISNLYSGVGNDQTIKSVETTVAEMSDEQVRRLLIDELKAQVDNETNQNEVENEKGTFVYMIDSIKDKISLLQQRFAFLVPIKKDQSKLSSTSQERDEIRPVFIIFHIVLIFIAAFLIELLFFWYTSPLKKRLLKEATSSLTGKIGSQLLRLILEMLSLFIFVIFAVIVFPVFFNNFQQLLAPMTAYLSAIVVVRMVMIVTRFFLSPQYSSTRFLPLNDRTASYLHHWIRIISITSIFGLFTCGLYRYSGASDVDHIKALLGVSFITAVLLIVMILQKRKHVMGYLSENYSEGTLGWKLAPKWHHFAIMFVIILLIASSANIMIGNVKNLYALKTLPMIPLYFLVDWILRRILDSLFGFVPKNRSTAVLNHTKASTPTDKNENIADSDSPISKKIEFHEVKEFIVTAIRVSLAALFVVWVFNIWGVQLPIGKAIIKAIFNILVVMLLCYVIWELLNTIIQRRIEQEMPDTDEEMEEGGAGGSRLGTLLLLLRKFLVVFISTIATMIVLSSIGVDIGPLIAGAGVIGLAIGFGAQTLVKDIISGIFFLIDDAFRVGDFIKIGAEKGTVEELSIRSFKLRHPRGMLNTIPFGSIGTVTNFSRDYIITKLDFRVKYDTDVEKVRKIVKKKVYKIILKNEELAPKLLGKIKSQGVRQLEDSAMIMRVKFKAIPGEQFGIRKEVFRLIQEAFKEEGIEFAHKNVTVYIPPDNDQSSDQDSNDDTSKKISAAAAAAAVAEEQSGDQQRTEKST